MKKLLTIINILAIPIFAPMTNWTKNPPNPIESLQGIQENAFFAKLCILTLAHLVETKATVSASLQAEQVNKSMKILLEKYCTNSEQKATAQKGISMAKKILQNQKVNHEDLKKIASEIAKNFHTI